MAAYVSEKTLRAVQLVKEGLTPAKAAKLAGIHQSTLTRNKDYIKWRKEQEEKAQQQKGTES